MDLIKFLSNSDNEIPIEPCIVFTTYNYFLANRTPELMKPFTDKKWGLIVFDEIKKGNCDHISTISNKIQCNGKLGLTNFMLDDSLLRLIDSAIGPYLYSKSLKELIDEKYYPNVQCYQVFCKMTHEFMYEYLNNKNILMKRLLAGLNPNKIMTLHRLIRMHEDKGDKINPVSRKSRKRDAAICAILRGQLLPSRWSGQPFSPLRMTFKGSLIIKSCAFTLFA